MFCMQALWISAIFNNVAALDNNANADNSPRWAMTFLQPIL